MVRVAYSCIVGSVVMERWWSRVVWEMSCTYTPWDIVCGEEGGVGGLVGYGVASGSVLCVQREKIIKQ